MWLDRAIKWLLPREDHFFELLSRGAQCAKDASALLVECVRETDAVQREEKIQRLKGVENDADRVIIEVYKELNRTFVTPIDRSDIYNLASELESMTDLIYSTALQISVHSMEDLPLGSVELAVLIQKASEEVFDAVSKIQKKNSHLEVRKILLSLVLSPLIGMLVAFLCMLILFWVFRKAAPVAVSGLFRRLQMLSAGFMALSHGSNDAQKTMGVITMALVAYGALEMTGSKLAVPTWVILCSAAAMGLGTAAGGVRIIKTLGTKIIDLKPIHGFAAETAAAAVIFSASHLGLPVSTTHCISGSILGVGASQSVSAVRWGITVRILYAWILTIPISAACAYAMYIGIRGITGLA